MVGSRTTLQHFRMEFRWWRNLSSRRYRDASSLERRVLELQITAAIAIRRRRKAARVSQRALAQQLQTIQARISMMEQAKPGLPLDLHIPALLVLGANDEEIVQALNPATCWPVQRLRFRASLPYYPKPMDQRGPRNPRPEDG